MSADDAGLVDGDDERELPGRDELLENLAAARFDKSINVAAIKLLLEELRRDADDDTGTGFDALDADELAPRRNRKAS